MSLIQHMRLIQLRLHVTQKFKKNDVHDYILHPDFMNPRN